MKRFIILIAMVILVVITYPNNTINDKSVVDGEYDVVFHMTREIYLDNATTQKGGMGYDVVVPFEYVSSYRSLLKDRIGETIYVEGADINYAYRILENLEARVVSYDEVSGVMFINAYTRRLSDYINSQDNKINVQIAITEDRLVFGTPVIIGSC